MQPTPMNRMSALDAEFYFAEHADAPLHMGSVAVFDGPVPEYRDITRLFAAKLPRVPRYRQVVSTLPRQLPRPGWAGGEHFQIRHHVRHVKVPAPGGDEQLRAVAAKLFARRLDLSRPLWEEWLLTGLADGRWAILSKVHHCMADGIGGNDLMTLVFGTDPDAAPPEPVSWVPAPGPRAARAGELGPCARPLARRPGRGSGAGRRDLAAAPAGRRAEDVCPAETAGPARGPAGIQPRPEREHAAAGGTVGQLPQRADRAETPLGLDHDEPDRAEADPPGPRRHHQRRRARRDHRGLPGPAGRTGQAHRGPGRAQPGAGLHPRP